MSNVPEKFFVCYIFSYKCSQTILFKIILLHDTHFLLHRFQHEKVVRVGNEETSLSSQRKFSHEGNEWLQGEQHRISLLTSNMHAAEQQGHSQGREGDGWRCFLQISWSWIKVGCSQLCAPRVWPGAPAKLCEVCKYLTFHFIFILLYLLGRKDAAVTVNP